MIIRWAACVAPLGEPSADHRLLDPAGPWRLAVGAPLLTIGENRRQVGTFDTLDVFGDELRATGTVNDETIAAQMDSGELRPALELGEDFAAATVFADDQPTFRWVRGTFTALALSDHPSWPGRVWFTLEDR